MTPKKENPLSKNSFLSYVLKIAATAILAFISALCFRQSAGIIAMFPIVFVLCGIASFIGINWQTYAVIFGVTVFFVNTIEQSNIKITLMYTALCLLACFLFSASAWLIKKNKKSGVPFMGISAVLCVVLSVIFIGNPITALSAKNAINDYTATKYPQNENAVLGDFEFSKVYYNFNTKAFESKATSSMHPTESGIISYSSGKVYDQFQGLMQEKLCQPFVLEFTSLLREYFPDDTFSVNAIGIASKPDEKTLSASKDELYGRIIFEIYLGGVQTANGMSEKVGQYMQVIDGTHTKYSKIIFKSGISPWVLRKVTVNSNRPFGFDKFPVEHVNPQTSERFNTYVSEFLS